MLSAIPTHDVRTAVLVVPHTGAFEISGKQSLNCTAKTHWCHFLSQFWCLRTESNRRRPDLQSSALPTELPRQIWSTRLDSNQRYVGVAVRSHCPLVHECKWLGWLDSNQRMRESKSLALPLGDTPILVLPTGFEPVSPA